MKRVFLDPDGSAVAWLYVVVRAPTGVTYEQQYGGHATLQGLVEGFLVPVAAPEALAELRQLFERRLRGCGVSGGGFRDEHLLRLREIVGTIRYWASDEPALLVFEEGEHFDEAWVPVRTPDGPGVLVWRNSD